MTTQRDEVFEFGGFRLDPRKRRLTRAGEVVPLAPKAFDLLHALVDVQGAALSKSELLERVWPGIFVEEANLPQNISLIRKALGESRQDHRFIVTLPGTGYRFAAPVTVVPNGPVAPVAGSVAVLPFINQTGDAALDYWCDGLTEGLIRTLSRISGLRVKARAVVFRLKGQASDPLVVGRELGVALVVVGRVSTSRVVVELVDTVSGWQVWTGEMDATPSESMAVQEQLARQVASSLRVPLSTDEQRDVEHRVTRSSPAYQSFMKGRYFLNRRLTETLAPALACFRDATDQDPAFALAYVGLADTYVLLSLYGTSRPIDVYPPSRAAALQALALDDSLAEAHNSLAVCELFYGWNWSAAEGSFLRALDRNPDYADAHQRYGMYLVARGRFDDAREALAIAQALDPLSLITGTIAGYPDYYQRRYAEAEQQFSRVLQLDPQFSMAHFRRGLALTQLGRYDEAEAALQTSKRLSDDRDVVAALGRLWALQRRVTDAEAAIAELHERSRSTFVTAYALAAIEAALGRMDEACAWLERALEERSYWLIYLDVDPALDPLRGDARFARIRERMREPMTASGRA
ncbi:MAG: winged helix-turn-helix domain-containing tetratricopeptide repeat protein [Vicinamibacterales bacterium]